jgi:septation ring formation regulator EzrA
MSKDEFTKLFKYMEKRLDKIESRLEQTATKKQVDGLISTVDGLAKQILDLNQEHLMLSHKVDRIEDWVQEIAQKTGVKLTYK